MNVLAPREEATDERRRLRCDFPAGGVLGAQGEEVADHFVTPEAGGEATADAAAADEPEAEGDDRRA